MVKVKSAEECKSAYREAISYVPARFAKGVQAATGIIEASKAGQDLYVRQMQKQDVLARRLKGLDKVTDADWKKAALEKGAARIGAGMTGAVDKQQNAWAPCRSALESLTLPARTDDSDINIDNRCKPVAKAMKQAVGK